MNGKGAGSFAGRQFFAGTPAIPDPGARDGWGDRDMMAIRGTLLWNMPTDGRLKLKVFTSRDQGENQVSDSVQGVSNNGFLEPDDDPYTFYRSEEHTSELQSLMRISYAVFCLTTKKSQKQKRKLQTI